MFSPGAPVDVSLGGDWRAEIAYGNHPISESRAGAVHEKNVQDVVNGRASAFKRLSVSDIRR